MVKINQLFKKSVDHDVVLEFLKCYGLKSLDDKKAFGKRDLLDHNTVAQLEHFKDVLRQFYLPCKAKIYLENLNEKKCITILRQIIRTFNYKVYSKEKNINGTKIILYTMDQDTRNIINFNVLSYGSTMLHFN